MSTILNTNGEPLPLQPIDNAVRGNFYVITADWNPAVTHALRDGAKETLEACGVESSRIKMLSVPGTVELISGAAMCIEKGDAAAVIVIGCVIRGDTPHFDYVCMIAAQGVAALNSGGKSPVIFGVLTVNTLDQALERAGGRLGNKGSEAASAAVSMANLKMMLNM